MSSNYVCWVEQKKKKRKKKKKEKTQMELEAMASTSQQLNNSVIDTEMYRALVRGDISEFEAAIARNQVNVLELQQSSDNKNTVLHIAASSGKAQLVHHILSRWSELMLKKNSEGDLPIHVALKSGKQESVTILIGWLEARKETGDIVLGWKNNEEGSTPLHIALEYDLQETAEILVGLYPPASFALNNEGICPLYMAIQNQNLELVRWMMSKLEIDVDKRDALDSLSKGKSVLHAAVNCHQTENSSIEILKEMLSYDDEVLIKTKDAQGWTALSCAAFSGFLEKVEVFIEKVPNAVFVNNQDESFPIHAAVHGGNSDIIDLLKNTWSLLNAQYQNILHVAVLTESSRIVSHLLANPEVEEQSLINQKDKNGNTPLHLATRTKCVEVVHILIEDERVNITLSNKEGLTAKDLAKKLMDTNPDDKEVQKLNLMVRRAIAGLKNHKIDIALPVNLIERLVREMIEQSSSVLFWDLISLEDGNNVLHFAATVTNSALDEALNSTHLLNARSGHHWAALMEQANLDGDLPIHLAARTGNLQYVQTFLEHDDLAANSIHICERQNQDGNTALHEAVLNVHVETARFLFQKHRSAAYSLNKDNICPLFLLIKNLYSLSRSPPDLDELVKEMIEGLKNNENIQNRLKNAKSIFHMAILARRNEMLILLIETAPCLVNSFDSSGRSPLSYAAYIGYAEGVVLLIVHNFGLPFKRDKDKDGSFPIHYAAKGGEPRAVAVLMFFGGSVILMNNNKQNALHVAAEKGRLGVVDWLLRHTSFKELVNTGDVNGNTALHLAAMGFHELVLARLVVKEKHINVKATNKELLTARDLAEKHPTYHTLDDQSFGLQRLCWPRLYREFYRKRVDEKKDVEKQKEDKKSSTKPSAREKANMLLVVATLLIGISYNAIIRLPVFSTLYDVTINLVFMLAMLAAQFLLIAAMGMADKFSKQFFLVGSVCIYCGLILMTVSSGAGFFTAGSGPYSKLNTLLIATTATIYLVFFIPVIFFIRRHPKYIVMLSSFRVIPEDVIDEHPDDVDI